MPGLELVVELLAQPRGDFCQDLAGIDGRVHACVDREHDAELAEIGFHGRLHVGILELGGELPIVETDRPMHLAERGGGGGLGREALAR